VGSRRTQWQLRDSATVSSGSPLPTQSAVSRTQCHSEPYTVLFIASVYDSVFWLSARRAQRAPKKGIRMSWLETVVIGRGV
jgi:hypothetical protein